MKFKRSDAKLVVTKNAEVVDVHDISQGGNESYSDDDDK